MGNKGGRPQCTSRCSSDPCHWKLFQHDNYKGANNDMCQRDSYKEYFGKASWLNWQFKNDDVSSISVSSNSKKRCSYRFFQNSSPNEKASPTGWILGIYTNGDVCCDYTRSELEAVGFKVISIASDKVYIDCK